MVRDDIFCMTPQILQQGIDKGIGVSNTIVAFAYPIVLLEDGMEKTIGTAGEI